MDESSIQPEVVQSHHSPTGPAQPALPSLPFPIPAGPPRPPPGEREEEEDLRGDEADCYIEEYVLKSQRKLKEYIFNVASKKASPKSTCTAFLQEIDSSHLDNLAEELGRKSARWCQKHFAIDVSLSARPMITHHRPFEAIIGCSTHHQQFQPTYQNKLYSRDLI